MRKNALTKKGNLIVTVMLILTLTIISCGNVAFAAKMKNSEYIYNIDKKTNTVQIQQYIGSKKQVTIPKKIGGKKVAALSNFAFANTKVTKVTIPNSVTKIGRNCFENCKQLRTVTIPDSVTKMGSSCFENCIQLRTITLPKK